MNPFTKIIFTSVIALLLSGCDFAKDVLTYKDKTRAFVETLIAGDYNESVEHFAVDFDKVNGADKETMKRGLAEFRNVVVSNLVPNWIILS